MNSLSVQTMLETCRHMVHLLKTAMSHDHATVSKWFVSHPLPRGSGIKGIANGAGLCCRLIHGSTLPYRASSQDHGPTTRFATNDPPGRGSSGDRLDRDRQTIVQESSASSGYSKSGSYRSNSVYSIW